MSVRTGTGDSYGDLIEILCDRFEGEWKAGAEPEIARYLAEVPEAARPNLLPELLRLEIDYKKKRGDTILLRDYIEPYPEHATLIETLLGPAMLPDEPDCPKYAGRYRLDFLFDEGGMGDI